VSWNIVRAFAGAFCCVARALAFTPVSAVERGMNRADEFGSSARL
jgi:hypothetical protein